MLHGLRLAETGPFQMPRLRAGAGEEAAMNAKAVAVIGGTVILAVASAAAVKLYDVPTKVAVLESKQGDTEKRLDRIDGKLDTILDRLPARGSK